MCMYFCVVLVYFQPSASDLCKTDCTMCPTEQPKTIPLQTTLFKLGTTPTASTIFLPRLVTLLSWSFKYLHPLLVVQSATTEDVLQTEVHSSLAATVIGINISVLHNLFSWTHLLINDTTLHIS